MEGAANFTTIMWVAIYMIVVLIIGFIGNKAAAMSHASGQTTWTEEFFTGAKTMGPVVLGFTFAATFASGGTFIGHPALGYVQGITRSWAYMCAIWCGLLPFLLLGRRCFRVGQKINALSINDVIEYRYENDKIVSFALIGLIIFFYMAYIVSQLSAGAWVMTSIVGGSYTMSLFIFTAVIIIYVTAAGMRGVAWTDTMQGAIMLLVAICILPAIIVHAGGLENVTGSLNKADPALLRGGESGTLAAFGAMVSFMFATHGFQGLGQPAAAQRLIIYDSPKSFKWGTLISGFVIMFMSTTMVLAGSLGRAIFPDLEMADTVIPKIILAVFPPAVCGIFLAGILAAVKSSADSYMLCVSTAVTKDLVMDYVKKDISDKSADKLTKIVTIVVGILGMVLALQPPAFIGLLVLYAWKGLGLCIGIPLVFGCMWKRANRYGAIASMIAAFVSYVFIDKFYSSNLFGLDLDSGVWGLIVGVIAMVAVSLATRPTDQKVLDVFFDEDKIEAKRAAVAAGHTVA